MSKRRSWTQAERIAQFEAQGGLCHAPVCRTPIDLKTAIAEHEIPVALGNAGKPDYLLCPDCAAHKTKADVKRIAKAKRQQAKHLTGRGRARKGPKLKGGKLRAWRRFNGEIVRSDPV